VTSGLVCILTESTTTVPDKEPAKPRRQLVVIEVDIQSPQRYIEPTVRYDARKGEISAELRVPETDLDRLPPAGSRVEIEVVTTEKRVQQAGAKRETTLTREKPQDTLRAYFKAGPSARAQVFLHVDGYPRAFIYDVALGASLPEVERKLGALREVRLADPNFPIYFPGEVDKPIPFSFGFDMPPSAGRLYLARLFIDAEPDGRYEPGDTRLFESYDDRDRRILLLKPASAPGMSLKAEVKDFVTMLDLGTWPNQKVHVRGQVVRKEGQTEVPLASANKELVLYLDSEAPALEAQGPRRPVYENDPFNVDLRASDGLSGIRQVHYALSVQKKPDDKDSDEQVLADPKPVPRISADAYRLTHRFEKEGNQKLYFQATDMSRNKSEIKEVDVSVRKPAAAVAAAKGAAPAFGRIEGRAVLPPGMPGKVSKVILTGKDSRTATPSDNGHFLFDRLPAGEYELKLEGFVGGNEGKSNPEKVIVVPGEAARPVTLQLTR
jgi:hypothetical protein